MTIKYRHIARHVEARGPLPVLESRHVLIGLTFDRTVETDEWYGSLDDRLERSMTTLDAVLTGLVFGEGARAAFAPGECSKATMAWARRQSDYARERVQWDAATG